MAVSYLDCSWRRSKESEKKCSNNAQDLSELNKKLRKGKFDFNCSKKCSNNVQDLSELNKKLRKCKFDFYLFEKVFEQCAGFVRIEQESSKKK